MLLTDVTPEKARKARRRESGDSDTDFRESESSEDESMEDNEPISVRELEDGPNRSISSHILNGTSQAEIPSTSVWRNEKRQGKQRLR